MNYLRIKNNEIVYPYTIEDLKADHRNVTFPATLSEQTMIEFDLYEVRQTPKPNDYTKNISEGTPILVDGVYYQNWEMEDASQSEIELRIETKWIEIKDIRNELLQECDWTQLSDIPSETKSIWTTYRQELRDITNQANPFNIVWPVKP
jgi:hypothetical protein